MKDSLHVKYRHTKNFFKNSVEKIDKEIFYLLFESIDRVCSDVPKLRKRIIELNEARTDLIEKILKIVERPTHVELVLT
jgi:hypothetical protein